MQATKIKKVKNHFSLLPGAPLKYFEKRTGERFDIHTVRNAKSDGSVSEYPVWVNVLGQAVHCICPDHIYRRRPCKHMEFVEAALAERTAPETVLAHHASTFNHDPLRFLTAARTHEPLCQPTPRLASRTGTHPVTAALAEAEASLQASTVAALDAAYAARAEEVALQAAWDEFNAVPSYLSRFEEGRESFDGATYGTCGHLSRNEQDVCPACRSKMYR